MYCQNKNKKANKTVINKTNKLSSIILLRRRAWLRVIVKPETIKIRVLAKGTPSGLITGKPIGGH